ncbi:MAG: polyphosphate polymerase domain-containing protein [Nocardioides sp.]|uniref:polyphosphate polymerase domain-containing protein n=1 Tax=Nocardioides sp. TaxID=35761 RepID=UPI0039E3E13C
MRTPTDARRVVDGLPSVGLDELVEQAALLHRIDRKYAVSRRELPDLLAALPTDTRVLDIDGRREFGYRSVYLDTPALAGYHLTAAGRRRRFKVRSRAYLDTHTCWLEVKTRGPRAATLKQRIAHHDAEFAPLGDVGEAFVDRCLAEAHISAVTAEDLRPVLATAYRRSTLLLPGQQTRVTIDTELGWTALRAGGGDLDRPGLVVVETKSGSTPSEVDRLLWRSGHRPVRLSKYAVGLAALRPDLPRNKWHRTLDHHLDVRRRRAEGAATATSVEAAGASSSVVRPSTFQLAPAQHYLSTPRSAS